MESEVEIEKVFVPVRRNEAVMEDELPEESDEVNLREIPRRWYVY